MNSRRDFIRKIILAGGGLSLANLMSACEFFENKHPFDFEISLAQWSLHRAFFSKKIDPLDFPVVARSQYQIGAVEYVNQFFMDKAEDMNWLKQLKQRCNDHDVKSVLIMVDEEGPLAEKDDAVRKKAVENHYKWVDAAKFLGCHSIRVNLHGDLKDSEEDWQKASVDGLGKLVEYAAKADMNVIVENHGGHSCKGKLLVNVMKEINSKHVGTLPDFGNFCVRRRDGDMWSSPCVEWYDRYVGTEEMLPYAKGVSAKSIDFDEAGNETSTDFVKMLKLVKTSSYRGYIGIEYEGERLSEDEGIRATKKLLEKVREHLR
ncbi:MAG: sugar phosphate isomerase/epimerase family protein [Cytophagaceae bacterium]